MSEISSPYPAELRERMIAPVRVGISTDLTIYPPPAGLRFRCAYARAVTCGTQLSRDNLPVLPDKRVLQALRTVYHLILQPHQMTPNPASSKSR